MRYGRLFLLSIFLILTACSATDTVSEEEMINKIRLLFNEHVIMGVLLGKTSPPLEVIYDKDEYPPLLDLSEQCAIYIEDAGKMGAYRLVLAEEVLSLAMSSTQGVVEDLFPDKKMSTVVAPYRDYFSGRALYFIDLSSQESEYLSELYKEQKPEIERVKNDMETWTQEQRVIFGGCAVNDMYLGLFFSDLQFGDVAKSLSETISLNRRRALVDTYEKLQESLR